MVNTDVLETLSVIGIAEGRAFISAHWFENVDKDGDTTRNVVIENPDGSGIYAALSAPRIVPTGSVTVQAFKNVSVDADGTTLDTVNSRTDGNDNAVCDVQRGVTYSGGTSFPKVEFPSSSGNTFGDTGGTETTDNAILVAPGDNLLTEVENISPATINITVEIAFTETLEKNLPSAWSP